ncbi:AAA family ATPase, partial [Thermodesulfatator autotrophicus]|uniref:AAA family ATPase n=1 Tax=Thermodesulfatator autotrophicus TaxID=1795632 RepID=UPI000A5FB899
REELKNFYSVLKDADPYLKFVFITGVTKFSKVSLFSGLNNLEDITISPSFATICGYTQEEFERVFGDRLEGLDLDEVRHWYNGYSWLGEPVYNPFDILLFLREYEFRPYWFETGT